MPEEAHNIEHAPSSERVDSLSPREREVLDMAAHGLTNHEVAARLHVTVHAVKFHLASVYRKLGVSNRTEAAFVWLARSPQGVGTHESGAAT